MHITNQCNINHLPLLIVVSFMFLILQGIANADDQELKKKVETDLRIWDNVLETYVLDNMFCPKGETSKEVADEQKQEGYWGNPIIKEPWQNEYQYEVKNDKCRLWSTGQDNEDPSDYIMIEVIEQGKEEEQ